MAHVYDAESVTSTVGGVDFASFHDFTVILGVDNERGRVSMNMARQGSFHFDPPTFVPWFYGMERSQRRYARALAAALRRSGLDAVAVGGEIVSWGPRQPRRKRTWEVRVRLPVSSLEGTLTSGLFSGPETCAIRNEPQQRMTQRAFRRALRRLPDLLRNPPQPVTAALDSALRLGMRQDQIDRLVHEVVHSQGARP